VQTTVKLGFNNVIDAFHVVGSGPVPLRFFVDERTTGGSPAIRLTDDLRRLTASVQGSALSAEAESRWRLVETAWQLNLPRAGVAVQADLTHNLLFVERLRRVNLTSVRPALNGYQKGRCFYCATDVSLLQADVDHFFPWILKDRGEMPDADGVWNLVLACQRCNRGEGASFLRCHRRG
jgi:5-methylcytosine-specific restriction endonuclease McrA